MLSPEVRYGLAGRRVSDLPRISSRPGEPSAARDLVLGEHSIMTTFLEGILP
jgi:hypothetical protein